MVLLLTMFGSEALWRTVGGVLQLVGVLLVAVGVARTRRELRLPGVVGALRSWFVAMFRRRPVRISGEARVDMTVDAVLATGYAAPNWAALDTEGQIAELKRRLDWVANAMAEHQQAADRGIADLRQTITRERSIRESEARRLEEWLTGLTGGNLHLEAWGALAFFAGIVMATWSVWIASLLG